MASLQKRLASARELILSAGGVVVGEERAAKHFKIRWRAPDGRETIMPLSYGGDSSEQGKKSRSADLAAIRRFIAGVDRR